MCVCVCMCMFMCVYMYVCACACVSVCVYVCVYVCMCMCMCKCMRICVCTYVNVREELDIFFLKHGHFKVCGLDYLCKPYLKHSYKLSYCLFVTSLEMAFSGRASLAASHSLFLSPPSHFPFHAWWILEFSLGIRDWLLGSTG
ncbi:hypothetical protein KP509_37G055200 [Ceratopteris richardii]|uniref:Secreted protein n=1 Tax=Ceratopteris richardii TaxID=49495 RepID=A0A8T2Q956_CERRI|nr:hypothetical protein KP509_37G055200 [Ceratopteris richardii]